MAAIHVPPFSSSFVLKLLLALSKRRTLREALLKSAAALCPPPPIKRRDDVEAESAPKYFLSSDVFLRLSHFSNNFSNSLSHFALNLRRLFWNCILLSSTLVSDELYSLSFSGCCCSCLPFGCAPKRWVGIPRVLFAQSHIHTHTRARERENERDR